MYVSSSRYICSVYNDPIDWDRCPLSKHNSVVSFLVNSSNMSSLLSGHDSRNDSILDVSYTTTFLGMRGLSLNIPFSILLTSGCWPKVMPPSIAMKLDITVLAEASVLYFAFLVSCSQTRKRVPCSNVGLSGFVL